MYWYTWLKATHNASASPCSSSQEPAGCPPAFWLPQANKQAAGIKNPSILPARAIQLPNPGSAWQALAGIVTCTRYSMGRFEICRALLLLSREPLFGLDRFVIHAYSVLMIALVCSWGYAIRRSTYAYDACEALLCAQHEPTNQPTTHFPSPNNVWTVVTCVYKPFSRRCFRIVG